jgi:hypothetical protein
MNSTINNVVERLEEAEDDFEIIGLHLGDSHQNCYRHAICGVNVVKGDILLLVTRVVDVSNRCPDNAISLVKMEGAAHTCTVAFVPRSFLEMQSIVDQIGSIAIVEDLYSESTNLYKRRLSKKNNGMAACRFLQVYDDATNDYE